MPFYPGDARGFTEYRSSCRIDNELKKNNKVSNDYEYKRFLQQNSDTLMQQNLKTAYSNESMSCTNCGKKIQK